MQLFFTPDIDSENYFLSEEESKHAVRVLRLSKGDEVNLIDGRGGFYKAEIVNANPKKCEVRVLKTEKEFGKRNFHLHIACAPTKNIERFEWFLEKAAEIGVDEITPIICEHSERTSVKTDRLNKVLVSAMKQSVKAYLPKLNEAKKITDVIKGNNVAKKLIAHCGAEEKEHLKNLISKGESVFILIGPEGDFSTEEIDLAIRNGFHEISLGKSRLRTETAAVFGCSIANLINE